MIYGILKDTKEGEFRVITTPLEVKLTEYQEDMEKTEGRDIE